VLYRLLFGLVLRRIEPERAHELAAGWLGRLARIPGARRLLRALAGAPDPVLAVEAFGRRLPSPLGVAAGLDKDLTWFEALGALGFGYVEVGTVTAQAQPGNPRPRVFRLPADRALINRMGFPNRGAAAAAARLSGRDRRTVVAVNVGRSKLARDAEADYRESVRALGPLADLLVLNVSSPNTPGLRDLQAVSALRGLIAAVRAELEPVGRRVPLLVKIAPDLADEDLDAIADLALELELDGLVAVNTTVRRDGLRSPARVCAETGGLSGAPLAPRALEVLRRLYARTGGAITLVSVGGICGPEDVWARLRAGATLVQAYTAFVYGGPAWPRRVNRGLADRVRAAGARSVMEVVGAGVPSGP
jgi:dihydroorotate dehydrogenase